jgi:hypothetical protein
MRRTTLREAQERLPELLQQAQGETIGLTDDEGNLVGLLAGVTEDELDDLVVQTPGFQALMARSRASLSSGVPVSAEELLAEAKGVRSKKQARPGS